MSKWNEIKQKENENGEYNTTREISLAKNGGFSTCARMF